jgi:hypothetical protein
VSEHESFSTMVARCIPLLLTRSSSFANRGKSRRIFTPSTIFKAWNQIPILAATIMKRVRLTRSSVSHWGTSPKFLAALRKAGLGNVKDLDDMEYVISAGSALSEELCTWFEKQFPARVGLLNGSGGTDCMSGSE